MVARQHSQWMAGQISNARLMLFPKFGHHLFPMIPHVLACWHLKRGWRRDPSGNRPMLSTSGRLIPILIDQNPYAHFLRPMDMIFQG